MKNRENSRIFQNFQFCGILGVFQGNLRQLGGVFGLSRGVLEASWGVLEPSWRLLGGSERRLGDVLEASWGILGASWTRLGENVEKRLRAITFLEGFWEPKWKQKSLKFALKMQLDFTGVFKHIFCDFSCFWKSAGEDMYHFFALILHRFFVDFLLISNPSKP